MCSKVVKQDSKAEFEVSSQLCLAINNIDFVLQYIRPFIEELGIDDIVDKLRVLNGDLVATSCKRTLVWINWSINHLKSLMQKFIRLRNTSHLGAAHLQFSLVFPLKN